MLQISFIAFKALKSFCLLQLTFGTVHPLVEQFHKVNQFILTVDLMAQPLSQPLLPRPSVLQSNPDKEIQEDAFEPGRPLFI